MVRPASREMLRNRIGGAPCGFCEKVGIAIPRRTESVMLMRAPFVIVNRFIPRVRG